MRDLIEKIIDGDDDAFEPMVKALASGAFFVFAKSDDEDGLEVEFLNYLLENEKDVDYIPLFTDEAEIEDFLGESDVPEGFSLYEFEGAHLAELIDAEQFLMVNPVTGGIVFQGAHLKMWAEPDGAPGASDETTH